MLTGANGLVNFSEMYMDSGITALTVCTTPAWAVLFGTLFFSREERLDLWSILGIILAISGVFVLHYRHIDVGEQSLPGVAAAFVAPILWAFGSLLVRRHAQGVGAFKIASIQMLAGAAAFFLVSAFLGESWSPVLSFRSVSAVAYLIATGSLIAISAYAYLLARVPAARVNTYALVNPIIALAAGVVILNELISVEVIPAAILIIGGLVIVYLMRNRAQLKPSRI